MRPLARRQQVIHRGDGRAQVRDGRSVGPQDEQVEPILGQWRTAAVIQVIQGEHEGTPPQGDQVLLHMDLQDVLYHNFTGPIFFHRHAFHWPYEYCLVP